ncbi:MAG: thrombospondin type 3 repeat-containing protein [Polyangiaceae bacterium]
MNDATCQKPEEDTDGDGVANANDNCPFVANDQSDSDGDGAGDACDQKEDACANGADDDLDGKIDCEDENCSITPTCADPMGDVDGDGAANDADNCASVANPDQADADMDGIGDACDKTPDGPENNGGGGAGGGGGGGRDVQRDDGCVIDCAVGGPPSTSKSWASLALAFIASAFAMRRSQRRSA